MIKVTDHSVFHHGLLRDPIATSELGSVCQRKKIVNFRSYS
jgi:hypothetical protein